MQQEIDALKQQSSDAAGASEAAGEGAGEGAVADKDGEAGAAAAAVGEGGRGEAAVEEDLRVLLARCEQLEAAERAADDATRDLQVR